MQTCVDVNVAGRVMLLLTKLCIRDARCLRIYRSAVGEVMRHEVGDSTEPDWRALEPLVQEQLDLLEQALRARLQRVVEEQEEVPAETLDVAEESAETDASIARRPSGYVPEARSMEEKLHDERLPIQQLVREDCLRAGLVDAKTAERLVQGMTGKTGLAAEQEIVEYLRQSLQEQVKSFIRKTKGGPWSDPRTQEDLRRDIHAARSVRSVLMMSRQILKEYQVWQDQHGRRGILGLFSPRKKLVR
jgi:hypothetical protein